MENPDSTAIIIAKGEAITLKYPFIPQAQGIALLFFSDNIVNPIGNGIPIKKEGTAIKINVKIIFK